MVPSLNNNAVVCSDYEQLLHSLGNESADLVVSDPPFGIGYINPYTHDRFAAIHNDAPEGFSYGVLAREAFRILKPSTAILLFTGWSTYPKHFSDLVSAGFNVRAPLICQKRPSGSTDLKASWQPNADWLLYATKGAFEFRSTQLVRNKRAGTVPNIGRKPVPEFKTRFPACWFGDEFPYSTENPAKKIPHPTPKSVEFLSWLIAICSDPGDLVVDPFVGSGSTAIAAQSINRRFIVGDVDAQFCSLTEERLTAARASVQ